MKTSSQSVRYRKDYTAPSHFIEHINLAFVLEPGRTVVKAQLHFVSNPEQDSNALFLHGEKLELVGVHLDGQAVDEQDYTLSAEGLKLHRLPERGVLSIENIIDPDSNTELEGLYRSGEFYLTQCEAEGFRKITYYPDRPDVLALFDVTIIADKTRFPVLLSNGNRVSSGDLDGNRHYAKWSDPHPKPAYLFALVAGQLGHVEDLFRTRDGRDVTLRIYSEADNLAQCDFAMQALKRAMHWDEQRFGLVYDLDLYNIVATNDFNMGAMENKGLNIFNSKYILADKDTATDQDFINVEAVIGHEYFHNWTGNRVTCRDWFQLSLKEGLTVFRDQEFTADLHSRAIKRIDDVRTLRTLQFAEDAGPMSHSVRPESYIEINNFYTLTVYEKGAEVVRMYHTLLGEEGFQKGMRLYFQRHDGQAVSCDDFRRAMADANRVDLSQFELWYSQNGTPRIQVEEQHDPEAGVFALTLTQSAPPNHQGVEPWRPMCIPIKLSLYGASGEPLPLDSAGNTQQVVVLTEAQQTLRFEDMPDAPVSSLFQGFSAPVMVEQDIRDENLAFLMAHDRDPFNRWDASQRMQRKVLMDKYQALLENRPYSCPKALLAAFRSTLVSDAVDPALIAETLTLPSLKSMINQMRDVDVQALHDARTWLMGVIAQELQVELLSVYHQNHCPDEYRVVSEDIAKRRLQHVCLTYLMETGDAQMHALCEQALLSANNFTDLNAALTLLVHHRVENHRAHLDAFYTRWSGKPLMVNRWLAIQATVPADDTLKRVIELVNTGEVFQIKNPNDVRSLIGAFCAANLVQFHRADGKGYEFLASQVLKLDRINPQIAARMVSIFNDWERFKASHQALIKAQLERIMDSDELSPHVYEIVEKSLKSG